MRLSFGLVVLSNYLPSLGFCSGQNIVKPIAIWKIFSVRSLNQIVANFVFYYMIALIELNPIWGKSPYSSDCFMILL